MWEGDDDRTYFVQERHEIYDKTTVTPQKHASAIVGSQNWVCIKSGGEDIIELRIGKGWTNPATEFHHLLNYFTDLLECSREYALPEDRTEEPDWKTTTISLQAGLAITTGQRGKFL